MAHNEGIVANFTFGSTLDYFRVRARPRWSVRSPALGFTREFQVAHELPNIAAWITNPPLPDAGHNSGELSFVYLALRSPSGRLFAAATNSPISDRCEHSRYPQQWIIDQPDCCITFEYSSMNRS